ncbi:MAG: DinB family protein [Ignavibacteriales bacterium]|nr:MAG: DinB family protein [Ignavibacteriales bacterium]
MKSTEELLAELQDSTEKIIAAISAVPDEKLNIKPAPEKWSAGECAEHIVLTELLINRLFRGNGVAAERRPDEKVSDMAEKFGDAEKKLSAFGPIIPSASEKSKEELLKRFSSNRNMLAEYIKTKDMSELITSFKHGLFGEMTRYEWAQFIIHHSERHRKQMLRAVE